MKKFLSFLLVCSMILSLGCIAALAAGEELSDSLYDFQVMIDGELYQFPMSFGDFVAMGWEYDGDDTDELAPWEYSSVETFEKGDLKAYAVLCNLGINTVTLAESTVGGLSVDSYMFKNAPGTEIVLPGGIAFGEATLDDITEAYGPASDTYESDLYTKLTYEQDTYEEWNLYVYEESGTLEQFGVRYMVPDEEAIAEAVAQVEDVPIAEVESYVAPEELGDDPLSFTVEYAGDLYQLPAPVSLFLANGWELTKNSPEVVYGEDYDYVEMRKDNQTLRARVQNYNANAVVTASCFVTEVESDDFGPKVDITIPTGITIGMSTEDVEAALANVEYEKDDDSDYFVYYEMEGDSYSDSVRIRVDKETDAVVAISVDYWPKELPYEVIPLEDAGIGAGGDVGEDIGDDGELIEGYLGDTMNTVFFDFTVNDAYLVSEYEDITASEGCVLLVVDMTVSNPTTRSVEMYDSDFIVEGYNADGVFGPITYERDGYPNTGHEAVGNMLEGTYSVGIKKSVQGDLVYEVPEGEADFFLWYEEYYDNGNTGDTYVIFFTPTKQ